jgi:general stress protein 26
MAQELPQPVLEYLQSQKTLTLATASSEGKPHARTYMYVNDGATLYIWARASSTTAAHVQGNPRVSFTIDEYVEDWNKAKGIQGDGNAELVSSGDEMAKAIGLFGDKYPSPSSGASTTNISFFKVIPTAIQFIDNTGATISASDDEFGLSFHREEVLAGRG